MTFTKLLPTLTPFISCIKKLWEHEIIAENPSSVCFNNLIIGKNTRLKGGAHCTECGKDYSEN